MSRRAANDTSDDEDTVANRQTMNELTDQMRTLLPVSDAVKGKMDRKTVINAATGYLYLRKLPWPPGNAQAALASSTVLQAMDHFCVILDANATVVYATENISSTFGYNQCQLFGVSLYDIIHPLDRRLIEILIDGATESEHASLVTLRFKTKQSKRTVGFSFEENGQKYKMAVVQIYTTKGIQGVSLMASGTVLDKHGFPDMSLHSFQCVFYTTMDLKLIHVTGMEPFLGKPWMAYVKQSVYLLIHPEDAHHVRVAHIRARDHKDYEMETLCVRLLCENGSYAYVTMYLIYRRAMANFGGDTIKIVVTYYGKQHPLLCDTIPVPNPNAYQLLGPSTSQQRY